MSSRALSARLALARACTHQLLLSHLHSYATNKVKGKLRKAGVSLTYTSLSLGSITGVQLQLASVSCSQSDRGGGVVLLACCPMTCSKPTQTHT